MLDINSLFPGKLSIREVKCEEKKIEIELFSIQINSRCPLCMQASGKIHSHYNRVFMDLPILGCCVYLFLACRKFFCQNPECQRSIFTERFKEFIQPYARQTQRLKESLVAIAFSASCVIGSKLSQKLAINISHDSLLNVIRKTPIKVPEYHEFIGVDDWAIRKGHNYGTIICDHLTGKPIELFSGRNSEDLEKWLDGENILMVTRDRSQAYSRAIDNKCPNAVQIADRFHLVKNLLDAVKEIIRRIFHSRIFLGYEDKFDVSLEEEKKIEKENKTKTKRTQKQDKKRELVSKVKQLHSQDWKKREIARALNLHRSRVKKYIELEKDEVVVHKRSQGVSILDNFVETIVAELSDKRSAAAIYRVIKKQGYQGSYETVKRFISEINQGKYGQKADFLLMHKQMP